MEASSDGGKADESGMVAMEAPSADLAAPTADMESQRASMTPAHRAARNSAVSAVSMEVTLSVADTTTAGDVPEASAGMVSKVGGVWGRK